MLSIDRRSFKFFPFSTFEIKENTSLALPSACAKRFQASDPQLLAKDARFEAASRAWSEDFQSQLIAMLWGGGSGIIHHALFSVFQVYCI